VCYPNPDQFLARLSSSTQKNLIILLYWALEACRGKTIFSGGSRATLEFLELLEGLGAKDSALVEFRNFLSIFL
jgi:hypothetical protein